MATSNCVNATNHTSTDSQKECCAVIAMREAVEMLAAREKIPYEEAEVLKTTPEKEEEKPDQPKKAASKKKKGN